MGGNSGSRLYEQKVRVAKFFHSVTILVTIPEIFIWILLSTSFISACWLYAILEPTNAIKLLDDLKNNLCMVGALCIVHGIIQISMPMLAYKSRRLSGISIFLLVTIMILFIVASIMLIYGGVMVIEKLPYLESKCREAHRMYSISPDKANALLFEAKGVYSSGALRYVQIGLWVCFVGYIVAMWGLIDLRGAKNICVGFLLISFGHLLLLALIPIFSMVSVLGYVFWLIGAGRMESDVIKKYGG